jgi:hypothetical protein
MAVTFQERKQDNWQEANSDEVTRPARLAKEPIQLALPVGNSGGYNWLEALVLARARPKATSLYGP